MSKQIEGYEIESTVPVPEHGKHGKWMRLVKEMQVGDSVVLTHSERAMFRQAAVKQKIRVTSIIEPDSHGFYRCWKAGVKE